MSIKPLRSYVLVKLNKADEKSKGGILLVEGVKDNPKEGEVLAIGSGRVQLDGSIKPLDVKVGDQVVFGVNFNTVSMKDLENVAIMDEDNIFAIK